MNANTMNNVNSYASFVRPSYTRRFCARAIDLMGLSFISMVLILLLGEQVGSFFFAGFFAYLFIFLFVKGRTLGDQLMHIELVSVKEGQKLAWYQVVIRLMLIPLGMFHGQFAFTGKSQLVHDRLAKTDMRISEGAQVLSESNLILRLMKYFFGFFGLMLLFALVRAFLG